MRIVHKDSNKPNLTFKDLDCGEIFYFRNEYKSPEDVEPFVKVNDKTCFDLKRSLVGIVGQDFYTVNQVGRIKGHFYVEEVM